MDIGHVRREYTQGGLHRKDLLEDPFKQFEVWFKQACDANISDPNAMGLATASSDAQPTLRTVLLKYVDADGFVFFTSFESTKAQQIAENPYVSLLFPWIELDRQVIVNGTAARISTKESLRYFLTRPKGSQLGAWVSKQSSVISSRRILEVKLDEMKRRFASGNIPLPSFWGGYRVKPTQIEFWQGRPNRLHDRFLYVRIQKDGWEINRLAP